MQRANFFICVLVAIFPVYLIATNTLWIHDVEGNAYDTITVDIDIINDAPFVAFQFDLPLSQQLTYLHNSAILSGRATDHVIDAALVDDSILRIVAYSSTNAPFTGDSGVVAHFKLILGSVPGNYSLVMLNPIIGDSNSNNILTDTINGILTLLAPDIEADVQMLDFDRIPLGSYTDRSFTIFNYGNQLLHVDSVNIDNPYFEVIGSNTFDIPAYGSYTIQVRFNSVVKDTYNNVLTIVSNDPDEPYYTVSLYAIAFAVNELHVGDIFAFSGDTVTLTCSINNMEPFVGFQFDMLLPEPMYYIDASASLSSRAVDHNVSVALINGDTLRVIAYSSTNTPFTGNDGDILYLDFYIEGVAGYYPIIVDNVIIADSSGANILSDYYNGELEIAAADIYGVDSMDFGNVSLLDTLLQYIVIGNNGNDTLNIYQIVFTEGSFWTTVTLPIRLAPYEEIDIPVFFGTTDKGPHYGIMQIFSNDPDESPFEISLYGFVFAPNYMMVSDTLGMPGDTVLIHVDVDNYEQFVAFQFDITFANELTYVEGSAQLTGRAQGHDLSALLVDSNVLRVIAYSMQQNIFTGNSGPVITMQFVIDSTCGEGYLPLTLSNTILGDSNSNNILWDVVNGYVLVDTTSPNTPTLVTPHDGYYINNNIVELTWQSATDNLSGVAYYSLEYDVDSLFINSVDTIVYDTTITMEFDESRYYWHVCATDFAGNESGWSEVWWFEVDTRAPQTPSLISPADSAYMNDVEVVFQWSAVSKSPVHYVFELDTTETFITPYVDTLDVTTDTLILSEARYYWHVKAYDDAGNESEFSPTHTFVVDTSAPEVVTLISPDSGQMMNDSIITFIWHKANDNLSGIDHYLLQYSEDAQFTMPIELTVTDTGYNTMLPDTIYYWRVKSTDRAGNESGWSEVWWFEVDTRAPQTPSLISPADNSIISDNTPTFIWSSVTKLKSTVFYRLRLIHHDTTLYETDDTTYTVEDSLPDTTYLWQVMAFDAAGNASSWAQPYSLVIDTRPPVIESTTVWHDTCYAGPFPVYTIVTDLNGVDSVYLCYKMNVDTNWIYLPMSLIDSIHYSADIPQQDSENVTIHYYIRAYDVSNPHNIAYDPMGAPDSCYTFVAHYVGIESTKPTVFFIRQNYPNPFTNETVIEFGLPTHAHVEITVYNLLGCKIATLVNKYLDPGYYKIRWYGTDALGRRLSTGVYFYRMKSDKFESLHKMFIIR